MQVVQELRLALRNDQVEEMSAEYKDQLKRQFPHAVVNFFSSWQGAGGGGCLWAMMSRSFHVSKYVRIEPYWKGRQPKCLLRRRLDARMGGFVF